MSSVIQNKMTRTNNQKLNRGGQKYDEDPDESKKGKVLKAGGTVPMGAPEAVDSGDSELDLRDDRLKPKQKKAKIEATKKMTRQPVDALTDVVAADITTGGRKKKKATTPPVHSSLDAHSNDEEESAMCRKKKDSISNMLTEQQEGDIAVWWQDNDQGTDIYRKKSLKHKLIFEKAASMGVPGYDADQLISWMKSMQTMYDKEKICKARSGAATPVQTVHQKWVLKTFEFPHPHLKVVSTRVANVNFFINKYAIFY